jgi:arylsulfatase A-like enzyme
VLTAYTCGLHHADAALGRLIETLKAESSPLLIVFYGDHLPDLGENLRGYRETGYCPPDRASECLPMRTTPMVIWNNYGRRLPQAAGPVSMCQAFPILLDLAGVPKPPHARLVEKVGQRFPIVSTAGVFDATGEPVSPEAEEREAILRDYRLMQYDLLFGEQYFLKPAP